jgi:PhnB protein
MASSTPRKRATPETSGASRERLAVVFSFSGFSVVSKEPPMQVNPYLFFAGNCEAAFKYYEKILGGKIDAMMAHTGTPASAHVPPEWQDKILHARLVVGDWFLMASDAPPDRYQPMQGFYVTVGLDTPAEAERVFKAFSDGGTVRMPMEKTFWAERFGMCVDRFGTPWMINCDMAK